MVACRMDQKDQSHLPVMLEEVTANLSLKSDGIYVDATFGRGGHTREILKKLGAQGKLLLIDKDPVAIAYAKQNFGNDERCIIKHGSFNQLEKFLKELNWFGKVDGILIDLGVSSPQLDDADRGFSFMREGKLDMRMNTEAGVSAEEWIAKVKEEELANVLWLYGEERFSRRIARSVVKHRAEAPITTTKQLAEIVAAAIPRWEKGKNPATRSFQAIRIAINHELDELKEILEQSLEGLSVKGRLLVISFHSLEDRIVKRFIQYHEKGGDFPRGLPITQDMLKPRLKRIGKALKPSNSEVAVNARARSAVLRIAEKLL